MPNFELFKFKNAEGVASSKKTYTKEFISFHGPFFHIYIENCMSFCYEFFRVKMKKVDSLMANNGWSEL